MRHDETPKIDEQEGGWHGDDHFCPPPTPVRRGTTFVNARPDDYVTEERPVPAPTVTPDPGDWVYWLYGTVLLIGLVLIFA